jgi:hypothetical protein
MKPCPEYDTLAFCPVIAVLDEDTNWNISPGFSIYTYDKYHYIEIQADVLQQLRPYAKNEFKST